MQLFIKAFAYLVAGLAVPDTRRMALDSHLAAECACIFGMLGHFDLLDLLAEGCTVAAELLSVAVLISRTSRFLLVFTAFSFAARYRWIVDSNVPRAVFTSDANLLRACSLRN